MTSGQNTTVGKLGKPHGISGAFRFMLYRELRNKKKLPGHFLIESKGAFTPFFIKSIELKGWNEGFITFEDITTPETARQFSGRELFLPDDQVETLFKPDADELGFLHGFTVIEEELGPVGTISDITETPAQVLATITNGDKESMIPLVEDFIIKIDKKKKEIYLALPEGLLDL